MAPLQPHLPAGWDDQASRLWASGARLEAVQASLDHASRARFKDPRATLQVAYYLFQLPDYRSGAGILERQLEETPDHPEVLLNLGVFQSRLGRWADSIRTCSRIVARQPDAYVAWDVLARAHSMLGQDEQAAAAGTQALLIKDALPRTIDTSHWRAPAGSPAEAARGKTGVIAFSLWGKQPCYLRGALRNLLLAPDLYPGWTLRFYVDDSVPAEFLALARELGADIAMQPTAQSVRDKLCWRFQVASDPAVGRFLVRDADSVSSVREALAVQAWCRSDRWFHVMRDGWTHTDLMLAGMWGGVAGVLPDLRRLLATYRPAHAETANVDQWFLRDCVWPYVRTSCLVHDRCFHMPGAEPFPGEPVEGVHVGQDEYAAHRERQASLLAAWIERHPCLSL